MTPHSVRLGLIQRANSGDTEANLSGALEGISQAADQGAQVVCLQELFRWPYFCQHEDPKLFDSAETLPGCLEASQSDPARTQLGLPLPVRWSRRSRRLATRHIWDSQENSESRSRS